MFRLNLISAAAVAVVLATGAKAADMPVYYEPEQEEFGGWYLRGDIGATFQISDDIDSPYFDDINADGQVFLFDSEWSPSWFLGGGVGYQINENWRVDVTGEYRFDSDFNGSDAYDDDDAGNFPNGTNEYDGTKEEAVFLFNAYYDFDSWGMVTPYVGAGVGAAWIKISDFTDVNTTNAALGLSDDTETWNFAAALYAGATVDIKENLKLDFGYRFLYMGDAATEDLVDVNGGPGIDGNSFHWDNIMSHDLRVGLRYAFN
jgi:opacity protein-like surface antigen